jgi:NAD-dependent dihydropyrimidine dehydrogenase PreA subunit
MADIRQNACCNSNSLDNILRVLNIKIMIKEPECTGCGLCAEVCPFGLPQPHGNGKFEISHPELCTECSACQRNCPVNAIILNEQKGCGCLWNARRVAKNEQNSCNCS